MKNIRKVTLLALLTNFCFVVSCSKDDAESRPNSLIFPQSRTITVAETLQATKILFNYSGNKIVSVQREDGSYTAKYFYTGDLLTKIEFLSDENVVWSRYLLSYSSNTLQSFVEYDLISETAQRTEVTYNSPTSVALSTYTGDHVSQEVFHHDTDITIAEGNIVELKSSNSSVYYKYFFDSKNNPQANQGSRDEFQLIFGALSFGPNNCESIQTVSVATDQVLSTRTLELEYDENDFLVIVKEYNADESLFRTIEYEY